MGRNELYSLIEEKINDIFLEYQSTSGIKSGDIAPLQLLQLEEIQNKLADLIIEVGKSESIR